MGIVISARGVKRKLPDAFGVCAAPNDLRMLARELFGAAAAMEANNHTYGWVHVSTEHPCDAPEGAPREWET